MKFEYSENNISLMQADREIGFLRYGVLEDIMYINGVVVDEDFRGQGLAKKLMNVGVDYARDHGYKIIPRCSYVVSAFDRGGYEDVDAR